MEEDKRKLNLIVVIVDGLLTMGCIIWLLNLFLKGTLDLYHIIEVIADIIASMIAFGYLLAGYSKGMASNYKACVLIAAINAIAVAFVSTTEAIRNLPLVMCVIAAILLFVLALIKDLGKSVSYILCGLLIFIRATGLASILVTTGISDPQAALIATQLCLALTITVITYAKYKDKDYRGTK